MAKNQNHFDHPLKKFHSPTNAIAHALSCNYKIDGLAYILMTVKSPQFNFFFSHLLDFQYATKKRIQSSSSEKPEHWLDHAKGTIYTLGQ